MSFQIENKTVLFFGSDTGNTEEIAHLFKELWEISELEMIEACDMSTSDYEQYDIIILGLSTWYDGDLQSDFEGFYEDFKTIDFEGKIVALFGLGDQTGYAEYFVDGLGILGEIIVQNGGYIIGKWPTTGYQFDESKGLYDDDHFYGLALDFENQYELCESRMEAWIKQLEHEIKEMMVVE